ncbi:glycoside hydrolase family 16 protein [Algoriphagus sp. D3-2-R+10]|uniref:glycoside hydrolase family 16 protein n=1 Tax=Algoriphagus aurantiacus TaxID=3103948 RepID=UPI002B3F7AE7|nr:glycoside hydrolase family 16 protein [Algoriphagus sp. D3-2-R+10]MEB2773687.1 glycoside hydrolase family 16 protein [Algoriphagus sp. D3-2-R+10]
MCRFLFLLLSSFILSNVQAQFNPNGTDYSLVWQEEFDVSGQVNSALWSFERGFVRNIELQWYQEPNTIVSDGKLIIIGKREQIKNTNFDSESTDWRRNREFAEYTSSSINTRGKYEFQYGIMEVRAKIDTAMGMWPAIWTLGITKPWPSNGEIDVMEYYRVKGEATILANAAWADEGQYNAKWDEAKIPFSKFLEKDPEWPSKFHIWRMEWTEKSIKLFLDDELLNEVDLARTVNPDGFNPFRQPHYILLNLAIGGNGGDPSGTFFPKEYVVDYVRVYQK